MGRALYYPVLSSRRIVVLAYLYQCQVYCASIFGSVRCTRAIRKTIYGKWSRSLVLPMVFAPLFATTAVASFFFDVSLAQWNLPIVHADCRWDCGDFHVHMSFHVRGVA